MLIQNEEARLDALRELNLLNTPASESFDRITRMASRLFNTPISAISLTDQDRQWFKSRVGVDGYELPRSGAPCAEVTDKCQLLVIPDLLEDERYSTSPLAGTGARFYAGAPLTTREGFTLGAMCVVDNKPRSASAEEMKVLGDLASMVMAQIELQHAFGRIEPLSGLPNRNQFEDDLQDLARDHAGERRVAILIDLADPSQFTQALRVLGPSYVDDLVREATRTIKRALGPETTLYQTGSTQFLFLLNKLGEATQRDTIANLQMRLRTSIRCNGIPVTIHPAIGIAPFRLGKVTPSDVVRIAHNAGQDAREAELDVGLYNPARDETHRRVFTLLTDMREALEQPGQLNLVYQPRVDMRSKVCVGAEALLRWRHPSLGDVSPGEFIPLVEQTALARPVTAWVIEAALKQAVAWRTAGLNLRMSINVSAANLEEEDFGRRLAEALDRHGVQPDAVELEFTESALIRNGARVIQHLENIRAMGVAIAIDDFGTGYSNLSYLQQIPASIIKIDRSFMRKLVTDRRDQTLVKTMITMAHDLGYRVVAEGIETPEVYDFLAACACDEAQGYLMSRPLPAPALHEWLERAGSAGLDSRAA